jgi:hypothetical protein
VASTGAAARIPRLGTLEGLVAFAAKCKFTALQKPPLQGDAFDRSGKEPGLSAEGAAELPITTRVCLWIVFPDTH